MLPEQNLNLKKAVPALSPKCRHNMAAESNNGAASTPMAAVPRRPPTSEHLAPLAPAYKDVIYSECDSAKNFSLKYFSSIIIIIAVSFSFESKIGFFCCVFWPLSGMCWRLRKEK